MPPRDFLEDNVCLGTMMLALGEVMGLVSGAVHSPRYIRPALQLIQDQSSAKFVPRFLFMCLPEQVLVSGYCAVIPSGRAHLADIAIQSQLCVELRNFPVRSR